MAYRVRKTRSVSKEFASLLAEQRHANLSLENSSEDPVPTYSTYEPSERDSENHSSCSTITDGSGDNLSESEEEMPTSNVMSDYNDSTAYETDSENEFDDYSEDPELLADSTKMSHASELAVIAVKNNLTLTAVRDIANLFTRFAMPRDPRSIMRTNVDGCKCDDFVHLGLEKGLKEKLRHGLISGSRYLFLKVNIDGIPLYNSSYIQFWPILCSLVNAVDTTIFVASVFCGNRKPQDLLFLEPFVNELAILCTSGLLVNGNRYYVRLSAVICDAPARSMIKAVIGHTGYGACDRCYQKGVRVENRQIYPDLDCKKRTDDLFRARSDPKHHKGFSPFLKVPCFDMIYNFPLDPMHLLDLGVTKRLLNCVWLGTLPHRFSAEQKKMISDHLISFKSAYPREFNRKGRSLDEIKHWKAAEFQSFLLYSGPLVLQGILSDEKYDHFLHYHVAIRILSDRKSTAKQIDFAEWCLKYFISKFAAIYGLRHLVYNVHSLQHLADDCRTYGSLKTFSASPFESFLGRMKRLIRGTKKPLAQLIRRLSEMNAISSISNSTFKKKVDCTILPGSEYFSYSIVPGSKTDSLCLLEPGVVVKVTKVVDDTVYFQRMKLLEVNGALQNFFDGPVRATDLRMYMTSGMIGPMEKCNISKFNKSEKCIHFQLKKFGVVCPILK